MHGSSADSICQLNDPSLIVRHVDLKAWMHRYYPVQRPRFLSSHNERCVQPTITIEWVQNLLIEREVLKANLKCYQSQQRYRPKPQGKNQYCNNIGFRADISYLNIFGAMLSLFLGNSPSGQWYSSFRPGRRLYAHSLHATVIGWEYHKAF